MVVVGVVDAVAQPRHSFSLRLPSHSIPLMSNTMVDGKAVLKIKHIGTVAGDSERDGALCVEAVHLTLSMG